MSIKNQMFLFSCYLLKLMSTFILKFPSSIIVELKIHGSLIKTLQYFAAESGIENAKPKPVTALQRQREREEKRRKKMERAAERKKKNKGKGIISDLVSNLPTGCKRVQCIIIHVPRVLVYVL